MSENTIDITPEQPGQALQRVESGAVGRALSIDELHRNLEFIRDVMRREMKEGQDYGKIPGTGEKPTLLQPGAQKLLMTFNLTEAVKSEVLRQFEGHHREYELTLTVKAPNGKEWDGVGTCSTLESKYRYRKVERTCPTCGKQAIIPGKAEFGGGWLCWKKKGGCGAKFVSADPKIVSQPSGRAENPDIADTWNTVRKMAFKRALVHASINATNTSELWTQDLEEGREEDNPGAEPEPRAESPSGAPVPLPAQTKRAPSAKPKLACATEKTRDWALKRLLASEHAQLLPEWLEAVGWLLPAENLQDWPLRWVPVTTLELNALLKSLSAFASGEEAKPPYEMHEEEAGKPAPKTALDKPGAAMGTKPPGGDYDAPDAPWRSFVMPFGRAEGKTLGELDKNYLYGLWANFEPADVWTDNQGNEHDKTPEQLADDEALRDALDQAGKHYQFTKK